MSSQAYTDSQGTLIYPVEGVLDDVRKGKPIIIVDEADRENEGDLFVATEQLSSDSLNFMLRVGRGLACVSISASCAKRLELPLQALNNNSPFQTPFTISIDHNSVGAEGVTASSRTATMKAMINEASNAEEFVSPGHVFPLIANPAGVIARQGQTEGSYDLARLAGLAPSGVICEILAENGEMLRGKALSEFAQQHDLKITSVEEIVRYRIQKEVLIRLSGDRIIETDYGEFHVLVFDDDVARKEHLALVRGSLEEPVLTRIHSECLTGDVFGSRRCDCGIQLDQAMRRICEEGSGILLYLRQEGRGIGLSNKVKAYQLQDQGRDTVDANLELGFAADERDFIVAAKILEKLAVKKLRLMTNNPQKVETLQNCGVVVEERIGLHAEADEYSRDYIQTKRDKLGHLL